MFFHTVCTMWKIFLPLRFYVKLIWPFWGSQKLPFDLFFRTQKSQNVQISGILALSNVEFSQKLKLRAFKMTRSTVFETPNWPNCFHVRSEWQ